MKMTKAMSFLLATVFAVVFAITAVLPQILQRMDREYPYTGVQIFPSDAEVHYAARMREIIDGFPETGNTFYSEPKNQPYLQPPYPEMVPAFLSMSLRIDPILTFIGWAVVSAFFLFLIVFWALSSLCGNRLHALLATTALLFAGALLGAPWDLPAYLLGSDTPGRFAPLRFSRPINPLWTVPWFFLAVWGLSSWWQHRSRFALLGFALSAIVLVYSYVYAWTFLAGACIALLGWCAWKRWWTQFLELGMAGILIALASLPYIIHLFQTLAHPLYAESSVRLGVISSHAPVFGVWSAVSLVTLFFARKVWPRSFPVLASLLLGGMLVMNQQILTGRELVVHHYHWYFFQPLASLSAILLILHTGSRFLSSRIATTVAALLLLLGVSFGILHQYRAYQSTRSYWGSLQKLEPILSYAAKHLKPGDVVYSLHTDLLDLLPVYSGADVYTSTNANNYLVSEQKARDVFFFDLWMRGVTVRDAERDFPSKLRARLSSALYAIHYREQEGDYAAIPDTLVEENIELYRLYQNHTPDYERIVFYPLHYVVLFSDDPKTSGLERLKSISTEVVSGSDWSIRKINVDVF